MRAEGRARACGARLDVAVRDPRLVARAHLRRGAGRAGVCARLAPRCVRIRERTAMVTCSITCAANGSGSRADGCLRATSHRSPCSAYSCARARPRRRAAGGPGEGEWSGGRLRARARAPARGTAAGCPRRRRGSAGCRGGRPGRWTARAPRGPAPRGPATSWRWIAYGRRGSRAVLRGRRGCAAGAVARDAQARARAAVGAGAGAGAGAGRGAQPSNLQPHSLQYRPSHAGESRAPAPRLRFLHRHQRRQLVPCAARAGEGPRSRAAREADVRSWTSARARP